MKTNGLIATKYFAKIPVSFIHFDKTCTVTAQTELPFCFTPNTDMNKKRKSMNEPISIASLPNELISAILGFCDLSSLGRLGSSCRKLHRLVNIDGFNSFYVRANYDVRTWPLRKTLDTASAVEKSQFCVNADRLYVSGKGFTLNKMVRFVSRIAHHHNNAALRRETWRSEDFMPCISFGRSQDLAVAYGREVDVFRLAPKHGNRYWSEKITIHNDDVDVTALLLNNDALYVGDVVGRLARYNLDYSRHDISGSLVGVDFTQPIWTAFNIHNSWRIQALLRVDHDTIVTAGGDTHIRMYSVTDGGELDSIQIRQPDQKDRITSLSSIVNYPHLMALGSTQWKESSKTSPLKLLSIRPEGLGTFATLNGHKTSVFGLSPAGDHLLASCSFDGTAKVWDIRTLTCVASVEDPNDYALFSISVDEGGRRMCIGASHYGLIRLFDLRYPRESWNDFTLDDDSYVPSSRVTNDVKSVFIAGRQVWTFIRNNSRGMHARCLLILLVDNVGTVSCLLCSHHACRMLCCVCK